MTWWQIFLDAVEEVGNQIFLALLVVCILALINELTRGRHGKGG